MLSSAQSRSENETNTIRVATFNVSLYGKRKGEIQERLFDEQDAQAKKIAAIIQEVRPDILLINEIDYDKKGQAVRNLCKNYFAKGRSPINYPYVFVAPSNTGMPSGLDLNNNAKRNEPTDAWGYGVYEGQYAMAVVSRFPIDQESVRTFQQFLWKKLPKAKRPVDPKTGKFYFDDTTWNQLRLSSKNHIDVPVQIGNTTIHLLASHPTPPVFDGREDRNGCRNHDEIRFWIDYIESPDAAYLVDDMGGTGGLPHDASFVIAGDLNSDPNDGDSRHEGIIRLLKHKRVQDTKPQSEGAVEDAQTVKRNLSHTGSHKHDTAKFGRNGNFRVDYVLPSDTLKVVDSKVFWPSRQSPSREYISASDHRLVWIEVAVP